MQYARLGSAGVKVSRLCLGGMSFGGGSDSWTLDLIESKPIIDRALDLGVNFFDTADEYSDGRSEDILGTVLAGRRNDVVIATKFFYPTGSGPNDKGASRRHIRHAVKKSLERLKTDYIDLYQIHHWDYETDIKETLFTLDNLVHTDECVNYIGASNMWAWQLAKSLYLSDMNGIERFVSMQCHYNLAYREEERETIPLCKAEGIGVLPWSPLARGFLSGRYVRDQISNTERYKKDENLKKRYFRPEDFDVVERLNSLSKEKDLTSAQLAIAWLLNKEQVVSPIVGVSMVKQLDELVDALDVKISPDEMLQLEECYKPHRVEGHV